MAAQDFAWVLLGGVWRERTEGSRGSWIWSGKSGLWIWKVRLTKYLPRGDFLFLITHPHLLSSCRIVCTTLGMLNPDQARRLKEAGLSAYNHNLDTSREFYPSVITTRSYEDRLATLQAVRDAGIKVCSGGILGLGEKDEDRVGLIWEVGRWVVVLLWKGTRADQAGAFG
jgi:hypothetical protein